MRAWRLGRGLARFLLPFGGYCAAFAVTASVRLAWGPSPAPCHLERGMWTPALRSPVISYQGSCPFSGRARYSRADVPVAYRGACRALLHWALARLKLNGLLTVP